MSLPLGKQSERSEWYTISELAHALTQVVDTITNGKTCVKLGATPERLTPANITARRQHLPKQKHTN
jgi:hypothetical protein